MQKQAMAMSILSMDSSVGCRMAAARRLIWCLTAAASSRIGIVLLLVAALAGGCTSEDKSVRRGSVTLPQRTTYQGVTYRLRDATFAFHGAEKKELHFDDDASEELAVLKLAPGVYEISLGSGWVLERQDGDGDFEAIDDAQLASPNPLHAQVMAGSQTPLGYSIAVSGKVIPFGDDNGPVIEGVSQCGG